MSSMAAQATNGDSPVRTGVPAYRLFDANAVTLATFLGTPVMGGALMAVNYQHLGQRGKAAIALIVTLAVTAAAILIGWNIPQGGSFPIALALMFAMKYSAKSLQGAAVKKHVEEGGQLGSKGLSAGLGVAFSAVLFGAIFLIVWQQARALTGPSLHFGANDEVYYAGSATKEDAQALGTDLKSDGYFADKGADVFLNKNQKGTSVSFIVKAGSWDNQETVGLFEAIGQEVAPLIGGFPIQVRLMDRDHTVKSDSTVGRESFGNDHVSYFGAATADEAQKLGEALKARQFFAGKGADVFLAKHKDGTTLSFVVSDGMWDQAEIQSELENVARDVAPNIGGLPVRLRLLNTKMATMKDLTVN